MKKLLIVIDMQNDFITGVLGSAQAEQIVPNVKAKIEQYRQNGDTILFTRDTHGENYMETQEGRYLPVAHCIGGTYGHEISSALDTDGCEIFDKPTFGSLDLARHIADTEVLESMQPAEPANVEAAGSGNGKAVESVKPQGAESANVEIARSGSGKAVESVKPQGVESESAEAAEPANAEAAASEFAATGYDEIELCGVCTDICVVSNALILKAQLPETKISVDASCCAGVTEESHRAALLTMKMCQVEVAGL